MFVISADQRSSRTTADLVDHWRTTLNQDYAETLALPADRNAGDEIQVLTADAATLVDITLRLTRTRRWSVGIGIGEIRSPLPRDTREASGPAFNAARDAVTEAKKRQTRVAVRVEGYEAGWPRASDAQSILDLLLELRARRSPQGWELFDTLATGGTQAQAAAVLGISAAAVSDRARAAAIRIERDAVPSVVRILENLERVTNTDPDWSIE
ncbi:MAG: DNA-binding protein [Homoserinimonas sp.]|jgi:hypothetical protein|nr:DNA-binding protein [Homoserinimonas sp.]